MVWHSRFVSVVTDSGLINGWSLRVLAGIYAPNPSFNKGAGYRGGITFYVCWKCVNHKNMYRPRKLQIGITRNANRVPWTCH